MPPRSRNQSANSSNNPSTSTNSNGLTNERKPQRRNNRKPKNKSQSQRNARDQRDSQQQQNITDVSAVSLPEPDENTTNVCSICAEKVQDWAIGICPHTVCGDCSHRMRVLYHRESCVMCNTNLKQVAIVPLRHYREGMTFDEAVALPGAFKDNHVRMWFLDRARHQQLRNVRGWMCSHKNCNSKSATESVFANSTQLRAHARREHRAIYCDVCFNGKKSFVSEMQLYNLDHDRNYSSQLRGHLRKDHPQCHFCRNYFLDDDKLYAHLQERHETCFICERNGRMHEYFLNYEQLENHYKRDHYVCKDEGCRGVVFATQIELQAHEHTRHGDSSRGTRSRALRVNLQQLHGERDARRTDVHTPHDVEIERERQAARRRAFLSSNVVFSGAMPMEDLPSSFETESYPEQPIPVVTQRTATNQPSVQLNEDESEVPNVSRPDDGHFHPLALPRDGEEMHARTSLLMKSLRSLLDPAAFEQYRQTVTKYNTGKLSADEFYSSVVDTFGERTAVRDILPEIVALLPSPFLREPLMDVCLRRTNTQLETFNTAPVTGPSEVASASNAEAQDEQFPTLPGAPAPRRAQQPSRRFGAPGPEEFPRLSRVNKPGQAAPEATTKSEVGLRSGDRAGPSSSNNYSQPHTRSAAQMLQETPMPRIAPAPRTTPIPPTRPVGRGRTGSAPVQLSVANFPSLGSSAPTSQSENPSVENEGRSEPVNEPTRDNTPPPADVSMRVGAVWGGIPGQTGNRGGRKRGPGRGRGRRPASPPKSTVKIASADDFPDIRSESTANHSDGASASSSASNATRPRTLDVVEVARARKSAIAQSGLPKIGGSGYGFAWDRKKVQQKKKEIKSNLK